MTDITVTLGDELSVSVSDGVKPYTDLQAVAALEELGASFDLLQLVKRGKPTTDELAQGEGQLYVSDGSDSYENGDLIYAYNYNGTIQNDRVTARQDLTE